MATQWLKYEDSDAYKGTDATYLKTEEVSRCQQLCTEKGYGGFVIYRGYAYFRRQTGPELQAARHFNRGSALFVQCPAPVVVQAQVPMVEARPVVPMVAARPAAPAAPVAAVSRQSVPTVNMPEAPDRFSELESCTESELTYLQANSQALEDWIAELPPADALCERSRQVQRANCEMAQRLLDRNVELERLDTAVSTSRFSVDLVRDKVRTLQRENVALRTKAREAPGKAIALLAERAGDADHAAEAFLQEAIDGTASGTATMSAEALTEFRQQYLQHTMEKHKRLAARELLLNVSG